MSGARTEQPTPRRLERARRRGDVATSRDLTSACALIAGAVALSLTAPSAVGLLAAHLRASLASAAPAEPARALQLALWVLARTAAPTLLAAAVAALACGVAQTRGLFSLEAASARWERVDPAAGLRRLASRDQLTGCAIGVAKLAVLLAAGAAACAGLAGGVSRLPAIAAEQGLDAWPRLLRHPVALLAGTALALGLVDLAFARRRHLRALRMTRDEVVREHREDEGDPQRKAERRRLHQALASARPVSAATCVVVNPTHLAVALHHARGSDDAPTVLAKGSGSEAARIRAAARRAGVPIVRDVALARALYRLAEAGDAIPEELYEAAAAVLVHVHGLSPEQLS